MDVSGPDECRLRDLEDGTPGGVHPGALQGQPVRDVASLPTLTLITPTADQPTGIAFLETYIRRQTLWGAAPIQWIVVDDGIVPADLTQGQTHLRRVREDRCHPTESFCRNLLAALPLVHGEYVYFIEHDDYYQPQHLEQLAGQLAQAEIAGDASQRYYNVARRIWRVYQNKGASLCQTAIRRSVLPQVASLLYECLAKRQYGLDRALWESVPAAQWSLEPSLTVVGIKGLPGRVGLGIGHRPQQGWTYDPDGSRLRTWIGEDAASYLPFQRRIPLLPTRGMTVWDLIRERKAEAALYGRRG